MTNASGLTKKIVVLLVFVATCQAGFVTFETHSNSVCSNRIARYHTADTAACAKRAINGLSCRNLNGVYYTINYNNCGATSPPVIPDTWQAVQLTSDETCNATVQPRDTSYIHVPQPISNTPIVVYNGEVGAVVSNVSMGCDANGIQQLKMCFNFISSYCIDFSIPDNICTADSTTNSTYGLQSTCIAPPAAPVAPVAVPMDEPMASPVTIPAGVPTANPSSSEPVAAPIKVPIKTPAAKTSTASVFTFHAVMMTFGSAIVAFVY